MRQMGTTMSKARLAAKSFVAVALTLLVWGCTTGRPAAPEFSTSTGQHPAAWVQTHWAEYVKHPDQCRSCHGSTTDAAQAGGISGVSCFKCHASPDHPAGWAAAAQHGRLGAEEAPNTSDATAMVGFAHCAKCHGSDYAGGISGVSCKQCHTKAPHPDQPWMSTNLAIPSHTFASFKNAAECFKCHAATPQPTPALPPGCFNNTMCHGS